VTFRTGNVPREREVLLRIVSRLLFVRLEPEAIQPAFRLIQRQIEQTEQTERIGRIGQRGQMGQRGWIWNYYLAAAR